jgi:hypothetical protein
MPDRELEDVWDGQIMQDLYHAPDPRIQPQSTVYTSLAFDGVEVRKKVRSLATRTTRTSSLNRTSSLMCVRRPRVNVRRPSCMYVVLGVCTSSLIRTTYIHVLT